MPTGRVLPVRACLDDLKTKLPNFESMWSIVQKNTDSLPIATKPANIDSSYVCFEQNSSQ